MKESIQAICPEYDHIVETEIYDDEGESIGWHSSAVSSDDLPLSSGSSSTKEIARRIALAELCERSLVSLISKSINHNDYLMKSFPSTSGFAFGFEVKKTKLRSIAEACERWVWSQWIDKKYIIEKVDIDLGALSKLSKFYLSVFDSVSYFKKTITISIEKRVYSFDVGIVLGIKKDGVYPGSRTVLSGDEPWEHSLLEAYRHLKISEKQSKSAFDDIIYKRIFYFSINKIEAIRQVESAYKTDWPTPDILLMKEYKVEQENFFLWRTLFKNFTSWTDGGESRFVY